ncbi:thioredoxin family protein [Paenibacillus sp. 2KB_20]|uniref:thioredoxin family protein n=1 Tax=Paenibacillus sp. 2KB_20 TaxID=3232977 RepID=UPI003F9A2973
MNKESFFLYFFSPTCGHCKATTPKIKNIASELGISFLLYNLLEYKEGWKKFSVQETPTLIYFKGGIEKERLIGGIVPDNVKFGNHSEDFENFFIKYDQ